MKRILITGANSYIGTSFEKWVSQWPEEYSVDTLDMIGDGWRKKSFAGYDVVFHVAGVAHVSSDPKMKDLYFRVNRDLSIEAAQKAKTDGVGQFIYMSSAIVYGDSAPIGKEKIITKDTIPTPSNFYGESKLQAEQRLRLLDSDLFRIVILRPPMIYGKGSKGNYPTLAKYARKLPFFPNIHNERSMLHIDNLCEFVRLMIVNNEKGVFFPQNEEYVSTSEMVDAIARTHGKKIRLTRFFNPALRLTGHFIGVVNKAFGNMVYEKGLSEYGSNYQIQNFYDSIIATESDKEELN